MLGQKVIIQFSCQIILGLLGLASTTLIARFGGPEILGTIGYVFGILGLLALFTDLGYSQAHIKSIASGRDLGKSNGTILTINSVLIGLFLLISLIYLALSSIFKFPFLIDPKLGTIFLILLFSQFFSYFGQALLLTFQARQEIAKLNFIQVIARIFRSIYIVLVIFFTTSLVYISSTFLIESVVILILAIFFFRKLPIKKPDFGFLKSYTKFAIPLMVVIPIGYFNGNIDKIFLNSFWGIKEVGFYFAIFGIVAMAQTFSGAAMTIFFPEIVRTISSSEPKQVEKSIAQMVKYLSLIVTPIVIILIFFSKFIVLTVLGKEFLPSVPVLAIYSLSVFITFISRSYGYILYAIEKHTILPAINVAGTILLIFLYLALIPKQLFGFHLLGWGATGAASASVIMLFFNTAIYLYFVWKYTKIRPYVGIVYYVFAGIANYFLLVLVFNLFHLDNLNVFTVFPTAILSFLTFGIILAIFGHLKKEDIVYLFESFNPKRLVKYFFSEIKN